MRTKSIVLCAVILLTAQTATFAQKTEVSVQKGKVVAKTANQSVDIVEGQKAVLSAEKNPVVTVDSPLVENALELYKLVEKEKERSDLKIDSTFIMVGKADKDEVVGALYFEFPNHGPQATNIITLGYASVMENIRIYDLNGHLCKVEVKSVGEAAASYSIYLSEDVQPGEHFKVIGVVNLEDIPLLPGGAPTYWNEGPLWYFRTVNNMPNCLNYFRLILPASAVLVDTNREIVATDTVDGRLAVTMRNYTGPYSDGWCMISFLYPEEDGTTLADIPDKYHGLRSRQDKQNSETFRQEMNKIRAGARHTDQSTPLAALLTCLCSIIHKDLDLYTTVKYTQRPPDQIRRHVEQAGYFADVLDFLSTPDWPTNPGNGYVHPIYLCRKGSMIDEFIEPSVYTDGKWYDHDTKQKQSKESEDLTPQEIATAKADGYLCDWEIAGPYIQKEKKSTELFDIPFGPELPDVDVPWHPATIEPYEQHPASVNITSVLLPIDQSVAYLRTNITSDRQKPARLEIYTDDGVKAWLNGKVILENNNSRGIQEQPDAVNITLKQGVNHLMLKVTEDIGGSRAIVRLVEP